MMESDRSVPVININEILLRAVITLGYENLKPQQIAALKVFVELPTTGYEVCLFCNTYPDVQQPLRLHWFHCSLCDSSDVTHAR